MPRDERPRGPLRTLQSDTASAILRVRRRAQGGHDQLRSIPARRDLERATAAAVTADLVLALGSTLSVYPAAAVPLLAAERGAPYIIVNRGATEHDDRPSVTLRLEGDVTALVPPAVHTAITP